MKFSRNVEIGFFKPKSAKLLIFEQIIGEDWKKNRNILVSIYMHLGIITTEGTETVSGNA